MLIGISGLIGSGKDTVADYLVSLYNFKKISFADKMKDGMSAIFGWDREMLEGSTPESRAWREQPDAFWSNELKDTITPRLMMQLFGTECMRKGFYDGVWSSLLKQEVLSNPDTNYVIADVRFNNEKRAVKDLGGELWQIRRRNLPEWWDTAMLTNTVSIDDEWIHYDNGELMENKYPHIHSSEWEWIAPDSEFDVVLENYSKIEDLKSLVASHLVSR